MGTTGKLDLRAGEQRPAPGARSDDAGAGRDLVAVGAHPDRAATRLDAGHAPLVEDDGTCVDRAREERLIRPVGERDAAVRVVEHRLAGLREDRPALGHLGPGEQLVAHTAGGERARVLGRDRTEVEPARRAR